jgi:triosephosphate isomerase
LRQLKLALAGQKFSRGKQLMVAYEPIWAIGSRDPATPAQAMSMLKTIRDYLASEFKLSGERVALLYGGSVDGKNAYEFLRESEVDGLLVGGASIKASEFGKVLSAACEVMEAQASV